MSLGEKLLRARQEAGLSQRQLCGEEITRNMLSQIEHGTASPSMSTLKYFARRLGKPVSYFLEEEADLSQNRQIMAAAWDSFEAGDNSAAEQALAQFHFPDEIYEREYRLLSCLNLLEQARTALDEGKEVYAAERLERARELEKGLRWLPELRFRRGRILSRMSGEIPSECLPDPDPDLYLLARAALASGNPERASRLLDACEDNSGGYWNLLKARAAMAQKDYSGAAEFYRRAEAAYPDQAVPALEYCYRELGDYKMAYYYACIARERK